MNFQLDATADELEQLRKKLKAEADKVRKKKGHKTDRNEPAEAKPKKKELRTAVTEKKSSYRLLPGIMVLALATLILIWCYVKVTTIQISPTDFILDINILDHLKGGNPLNPTDYVFD
jgi:hypothetical protein